MSVNICGFAGREAFLPNFFGPREGVGAEPTSKCAQQLKYTAGSNNCKPQKNLMKVR